MTPYSLELAHPFLHAALTCVPKLARFVWRRAVIIGERRDARKGKAIK